MPSFIARRAALTTAAGMLLVGAAALPAHAESVRGQQWFLDAMKAEQMWKTSTGQGITVAVLDTGVNADHPDLAGRILPGKDMAGTERGDEHTDYEGHGTSMAGFIAATGARAGGHGAFGLAPGTKILPVRLPRVEKLDPAVADKEFATAMATGIRYATDHGAKVINISQASTVGGTELTSAVKYALDKGALVFAGVGNAGDKGNPVMYPAATPGAVGVAAIGKNLKKTAESEFGPQVDMAAPGEDMVEACGGRTGLCTSHGTSDATAMASASAALIWSAHPTWTNNQVLRVMLNTIGAPVDGSKRTDSIGYGIVRPRIALTDPGNPGPADQYPLPDFPVRASAAPSVSPSTGYGDSKEHQAAGARNDSSSSTGTWVAAGAGAVIVAGAAAGFAAMRRRKRTAGTGQVAPSPAPYGPSPSYGPTSRNPQDQHRPY
ncbi:type VII secretion-associated serine protease mycosin [Streptomyces sp. NPDC006743]|uniref:type VII secretion-associated serine protease mycosin n=1 Tax=Streptomyces sp. NPDC006743 TaxID=3154480 RepID=UPI0034534AD7